MTEANKNLRHWNKFADIDPKFTKPITGKPYKGTSPNPQYVIRCLTDIFGPVGEGFGWDVVAEEFTPLGAETLHWCRIKFWHTDRANTFDSYGQTKAAYQTAGGKFMVDEDAPKKSLTDAIIKAASHVGIGANIFLGRWDDQKYVADVAAEYREAEKSAAPKKAEPTPAARRDWLKATMSKANTTDKLQSWWTGDKIAAAASALPQTMQDELSAEYNRLFDELRLADTAESVFPSGPDAGDGHEGDGAP